MNSIEIISDEGNYVTRAHSFRLADDMYLFFKFVSPKSDCEIGIAYDEYVDAGDWYVSSGTLGGCDYEIVNDVLFNGLPMTPEFTDLEIAVDAAIRKFNGRE